MFLLTYGLVGSRRRKMDHFVNKVERWARLKESSIHDYTVIEVQIVSSDS